MMKTKMAKPVLYEWKWVEKFGGCLEIWGTEWHLVPISACDGQIHFLSILEVLYEYSLYWNYILDNFCKNSLSSTK